MYLKCRCCRQHMDTAIYIVTNYLKAYKMLKNIETNTETTFLTFYTLLSNQ